MPAIKPSYNPREIAQYAGESDETSARRLNLIRKWQSCLKCGKNMLTDRCHRICPKCHQSNGKTRDKNRYRISADTDASLSAPREDIFLTTNYPGDNGKNNREDYSNSLDNMPSIYSEDQID